MDLQSYINDYSTYQQILKSTIRRTGADASDPDAATYSVTIPTYDQLTGKVCDSIVIPVNRVKILAQIDAYQNQIAALEENITNILLFLADADAAPLQELQPRIDVKR